jgi:lipopolysaccharide export system permease protein
VIISRYLAKEIGMVLLANTLILLLIFVGNQFVHYMQIAVSGHLTAHLVAILLVLRMPQLLGTALPLSLFLSIILAYGRMYAENEMTILFASGVNLNKIIKITLTTASGVIALIAILILWVSPHINKYVNDLLHKGSLSPLELVAPGRFQSTPDGRWVLYSEQVSNGHKKLQQVFVADQSKKTVDDVLMAKTAYQKFDKKTGDLFLVFDDGNRYVGIPGEKSFQIVHFEKYGTRIAGHDTIAKLQDDSVQMKTLWKNYKEKKAAAELQWRLSIPIMAIVLVLLAVPLSRIKSQQNRYVQLVPAILLFIVYGNFLYIGRNWIRTGKISIYLGVWWIHLIMFLLAIILIMQQSNWNFWNKAKSLYGGCPLK